LAGSTGKKRQVFWRDRKTGETRLVSTSSISGEGNGDSGAPAISADGKSVAFESHATNLVPIDTNKVRDVFVWNYDTNIVTAVSDAPGNIEANAEAYEPTISGDGRFIAFTSSASTLTSGVDGTSQVNVFLKDMRSGSVTLISRDEKTKKGGGGSRPSISEDGTRIAFYNYFPLISSDKNNLWDIYLWDARNPKLKVVSNTATGAPREQGDESASRVVAPSISGDGRYVAFSTTAGNVVDGDMNKVQDVFVAEADTGRVARVSTAVGDADGNGDSPTGQGERIAISYDGGWVAFSTKATNLGGNIVVRNISAGENVAVSKDLRAGVAVPAMSRTGKWVVFGTSAQLDGRFRSSGIFAVAVR
jgi:Tol biopolymer transport system component